MRGKASHMLLSLLLFSLQACSIPACNIVSLPSSNAQPPSHQAWTQLLQKHVDKEGMVDYRGFQQDRNTLQAYLRKLKTNPPAPDNWSKDEQLAYWINAYNAFTIELVLMHYPVNSIKDIGSSIQVPFVNTPWDIRFIQIGDEEYNLNMLEHNIIRPIFEDPRIHFALVCAARSCPKLRREAYTGDRLQEQLDEQAHDFLSDPEKNQLSRNELYISKIFDWYESDFTKQQSLTGFLDFYTKLNLSPKAKIRYMEYDWSLNEQAH